MNSPTSSSAPGERVGGPTRQLSVAARAALALIRAYKYLLSPWFTGACRFVPTCADYTAVAIAQHGFVRGSWLGARRLGRCHPFGGHGYDPVPAAAPKSPDVRPTSFLSRVRLADPIRRH